MPKKIGKVFGVGIAGLLSFFLLIFFVQQLFGSRGNVYKASSVNSLSGSVMSDAFLAQTPNSMMNPVQGNSVEVVRRMTEQRGVGVGMMETSSDQDMMAEKKMIKNASLSLRVENVDATLIRVGKIATDMGGDISDSRFSQVASGMKSGTVTVKIPVNKFNEAFSQLKGIASVVLSENTSGVDVTERFIDIQARINNKKAAEVTLQTLFERAQKISDVIEVTDKLTVVRGEIESLEGQLRYLSSQTDMASITLALTEDVTVVTDQGFRPLETLKESTMTLVHMLGNLTEGIIRFLIVGLPVVLVYGVFFWVIYRVARRMVTNFWPGIDGERHRVVRKK